MLHLFDMRALLREGGRARIAEVPAPIPAPDELLLRVEIAGVCRTDLLAARGLLPVDEPMILGHEFCGWSEELGRVAVHPLLSCGRCGACLDERAGACASARLLGLRVHGAFAEMIAVPRSAVVSVPRDLDPRRAAYAEPIAAALAVLDAPLEGRGLIAGKGRVASLIARVLAHHGLDDLHAEPTANRYDFVIETETDLNEAVRAVKPGGLIVLRSRPARPIPIDLAAVVAKEVTLRAVNYGDFGRAVTLAAELPLDDLFGPTLSLSELVDEIDENDPHDDRKLFVDPHRG